MGFGISFGGGNKKEKGQQQTWQNVTGNTTTNTLGQTTGQQQASYWTPEQQQLASQLSGFLSGSFGQASPTQQTGLTALTQAATGKGYDDAALDALYKAIEKTTLEDILPKSTQALAREANLAGMLRSGPALQMQLDNRNAIVNQLMQTLAGMKQQTAQAREERQLPAAQALIASSPEQQSINNMLQMLGIRGATSETSQATAQQQTVEEMLRDLYSKVQSKGKVGGTSWGIGLGL